MSRSCVASGQAVEKQRAVGKAGHRVVQGLVGKPELGAVALDREADGAAQHGRVQIAHDQIVLGAGPDRVQRQRLVGAIADHDDGDVGHVAVHVRERLDVPSARNREQHARGAMVEQLASSMLEALGMGDHQASRPGGAQHLGHQHRAAWITVHEKDSYRPWYTCLVIRYRHFCTSAQTSAQTSV